jgi:hypothetical protein
MGAKPKMKRVNVDKQSKEIQDFVSNLPVTHREGCLLIIHGKPLMKVVANTDIPSDRKKLVEAIRARTDESRELLRDWDAANRERWEKMAEE